MLFFDRRIRLCEMFENWVENNGFANSNFNLISWLVIKDLINEEKAEQLILLARGDTDEISDNQHRE